MQTDPSAVACNNCTPSGCCSSSARYRPSTGMPLTPLAIAENVRYVGALSRKLDNSPDAQKNCHGWLTPQVFPYAFRSKSAGAIVIKMPANKIATSSIGAKEN